MVWFKVFCFLLLGTFSESTMLTLKGIEKSNREIFQCKITNEELTDESRVTFSVADNSVGFNLHEDKDDVLFLSIIDTKLSRLPNEIFQTFSGLKMLTLENTELESWKREYLEGAKALSNLQIVKSAITYFPSDAFAEAPRLIGLAIINSKMATINPDMFSTLPKLETLELGFHDFSGGLPADTFDSLAKSLKYLDLRLVRLTKIPDGMFKKLIELRKLVLIKNKLPSVLDTSKVFPEMLHKVYVDSYITVVGAPESLVVKNSSPDVGGEEID